MDKNALNLPGNNFQVWAILPKKGREAQSKQPKKIVDYCRNSFYTQICQGTLHLLASQKIKSKELHTHKIWMYCTLNKYCSASACPTPSQMKMSVYKPLQTMNSQKGNQ